MKNYLTEAFGLAFAVIVMIAITATVCIFYWDNRPGHEDCLSHGWTYVQTPTGYICSK